MQTPESLASLVEKTLAMGGQLIVHHPCSATDGRWKATLMPRPEHEACTKSWAASFTNFTWNGLDIAVPHWFFNGSLAQSKKPLTPLGRSFAEGL